MGGADPRQRTSRRRRRLWLLTAATVAVACGSYLALRSPPSDPSAPATVLLVGDSHQRGALGELQAELVDRDAGVALVVNAFGGLGVKDSPYLAARVAGAVRATGGIDVVVVGLGTNDVILEQPTADPAAHIDDIVDAADGAPVLWLTLATTMANRPDADEFNAELAAATERHPNLSLVDFGATWDEHPEWFAEDGLHLGIDGREAYAQAVSDAVDERLEGEGGGS